jgi:hypothetical protein
MEGDCLYKKTGKIQGKIPVLLAFLEIVITLRVSLAISADANCQHRHFSAFLGRRAGKMHPLSIFILPTSTTASNTEKYCGTEAG